MQAVNVPVQNLPAEQEGNVRVNIKKADKNPVGNGNSFLAILNKTIACSRDGSIGAAGKNKSAGKTQKETGMLDIGDILDEDKSGLIGFFQNNIKINAEFVEQKLIEKSAGVSPNHAKALLTSADAEVLGKDLKNAGLSKQNKSKAVNVKLSEKNNGNFQNEDALLVKPDKNILQLNSPKKKSFLKKKIDEKPVLTASRDTAFADKTEVIINTQAEQSKAKNRTKKGSLSSIKVEDLRLQKEMQYGITDGAARNGVQADKIPVAEMSLDIKPKTLAAAFKQADSEHRIFQDSSSGSFSAVLAQEIRNQAADFVQAGKIILRNNNTGQIKLQLHPENLGSVKINLEMSGEKKLSGRITVSSKEAFEAFSESLNDLLSAFKENGFDTGGFDLNWSDRQYGAEPQPAASSYFGYKKAVPEVMALRLSAEKVNIYEYGKAESINVIA